MALNLVYSAIRGELEQAFAKMIQPIAKAATGAIKDTADQVKKEGRANIAAGGFSSKWQNALRVNTYPTSGVSVNSAAFVYHKIPYAGIFEKGGTISGKPLLWIPLTGTPARIAGRRFSPRAYRASVGPLVPMKSRRGRPLLGAPVTGRAGTKITLARLRRGQRAASGSIAADTHLEPIFIGLPAVHIRQRFNLQQVFDRAAGGLGAAYLRNLQP